MNHKRKQNRCTKVPKGAVGIHKYRSDRDSPEIWRLVWWCPIQKRRRYAKTGYRVDDGLVAKNLALGKAQLMTNDIATGNYDPGLEKYFPKRARRSDPPTFQLGELWGLWLASKGSKVSDRTLKKYDYTFNHLRLFERGRLLEAAVDRVGEGHAEDFSKYLASDGIGPDQRKRHLETLKACWKWGIERRLMEGVNPWIEAHRSIKVPPKPRPKPFTQEEIGAIVAAFRGDRDLVSYAPYVEFLLGTGCRLGEAAGLQWKYVNDDCSMVWIGETLTRGKRRPAKANRSRQVKMTPRLQSLLQRIKPAESDPEGLVFGSEKGAGIDDGNFRNRVWAPTLERLEIDYRSPRNTRHSLVSHALELGMSPLEVSQLTGHSTRVLHQHYAGLVKSSPALPEVF